MKTVLCFLLALLVAASVDAFVSRSAFRPAVQNQSSLKMTVLSYNGKKKDFKAGSPLKNAVAALGGESPSY